MRTGKTNEMLLRADILAHQAKQSVIEEFVTDMVGRRLINRLLDNPPLRPLLEIKLNGCTTYRATKLLVAEEFVKIEKFKARMSPFRGRECEAIEITTLGEMTIFEEQEGVENNKYISILHQAILAYSCIDDGNGICGTRAFLETALELPDQEILKRLVGVWTGARQFPDAISFDQNLKDEQRAQAAHWWSEAGNLSRSGKIVELSTPPEDSGC